TQIQYKQLLKHYRSRDTYPRNTTPSPRVHFTGSVSNPDLSDPATPASASAAPFRITYSCLPHLLQPLHRARQRLHEINSRGDPHAQWLGLVPHAGKPPLQLSKLLLGSSKGEGTAFDTGGAAERRGRSFGSERMAQEWSCFSLVGLGWGRDPSSGPG